MLSMTRGSFGVVGYATGAGLRCVEMVRGVLFEEGGGFEEFGVEKRRGRREENALGLGGRWIGCGGGYWDGWLRMWVMIRARFPYILSTHSTFW